MGKLFGTDGIRGVANIHPMTTEMAMQVGRGTAFIFKNQKKRHRIVIGKDTRLSGYMIENALVAGHLLHGGGCSPGRPSAHSGDRLYHHFHARGCGDRHFRLPQPLPG